jgi:hypothetical protein
MILTSRGFQTSADQTENRVPSKTEPPKPRPFVHSAIVHSSISLIHPFIRFVPRSCQVSSTPRHFSTPSSFISSTILSSVRTGMRPTISSFVFARNPATITPDKKSRGPQPFTRLKTPAPPARYPSPARAPHRAGSDTLDHPLPVKSYPRRPLLQKIA